MQTGRDLFTRPIGLISVSGLGYRSNIGFGVRILGANQEGITHKASPEGGSVNIGLISVNIALISVNIGLISVKYR